MPATTAGCAIVRSAESDRDFDEIGPNGTVESGRPLGVGQFIDASMRSGQFSSIRQRAAHGGLARSSSRTLSLRGAGHRLGMPMVPRSSSFSPGRRSGSPTSLRQPATRAERPLRSLCLVVLGGLRRLGLRRPVAGGRSRAVGIQPWAHCVRRARWRTDFSRLSVVLQLAGPSLTHDRTCR